ncbi:MAG TPA: hypothetical protein VGG39_03800 [Polyangiaceae bacterium]|jgi:hypothetical protein
MRSSLLLSCAVAAFAAGCSSGSSDDGSGSTGGAGPVVATCEDTFTPVYLNSGPTQTLALVTSGDGVFYQSSSSSIVYFGPDATIDTPPTPIVGSPAGTDEGADIESFWSTGDSLLLLTVNGLATVPSTGGALTFLTNGADEQAMQGTRALIKDATTLYGAASSQTSAVSGPVPSSTPIAILRQAVTGGPVSTLTTVTASGAILFFQLFDTGATLWLETDAGDVFSIAKSDGTVQILGNLAGQQPGLLLAPDGVTGMYGATPLHALTAYGFDGSATPLFAASASTFFAGAATLDTDGTAYVAGQAYSTPSTLSPAVAVIPPGGAATLLRCGAYGDTPFAAIALGTTVGYAAVPTGGQLGIVRFAK